MADSKPKREKGRSDVQVRSENSKLIRDITRHCSRSDYEKHNVLLIGKTGSGKSSVINTLLKVITGDYFHIAKAGGGDVPSNTMQLKRYQHCGAKVDDFKKPVREQLKDPFVVHEREVTTDADSFRAILGSLPDIFDVAGMMDNNTDETKEILRLLIGGYIAPNTNIAELEKGQREIGLGYLSQLYDKPMEEYKISMVVFVCACGGPIPYDLIKCVHEVLAEVEQFTRIKRYEVGEILLLTKYDDVDREHPFKRNADERNKNEKKHACITLEAFETMETDIAGAFAIKGTEDCSRLRWASYNDSIGYDNPYVDNTSLKLLKFLTTQRRTNETAGERITAWQTLKVYAIFQIKKFVKYLLSELRQLILQRFEIDIPLVVFMIAAPFVLVIVVLFVLSLSLSRRA